jgi:hypothetical protein
VSVVISDDAPLRHPDITTTIQADDGPLVAVVRVLTPAGGSIATAGDLSEGIVVGWVSGFVTIDGAGGQCDERFNFTAALATASVEPSSVPAYVRDVAPPPYRMRFVADVAGTPVDLVVRETEVDRARRLETTTVIGDPTASSLACAPFRARVILNGRAGFAPDSPPVTTAPPDADDRVYEYTLISRAEDGSPAQQVQRTVTAQVDPGLDPTVDNVELRWSPVTGSASQAVAGTVYYSTNCELIRRLIIREEVRDVRETPPPSATSITLPPPPGPEYELASATLDVSGYDVDGVLLDRETAYMSRPFEECWYAPGTEPILMVEPPSGPCDGAVTVRGERFPTDVRVAIDVVAPGTDFPLATLAQTPVQADGTFVAMGRLPASSCAHPGVAQSGELTLAAYNASEPRGLTVFALTRYAATGATAGSLQPPETGSGGYR